MTVKEWREKHPKCVFCRYWNSHTYFGHYCNAKEKFALHREAKECALYDPFSESYFKGEVRNAR